MERSQVVQGLLLASLQKDGFVQKISDTEYWIDSRESSLKKSYPEVGKDTLDDLREILRRVEIGLCKSGATITKPKVIIGG